MIKRNLEYRWSDAADLTNEDARLALKVIIKCIGEALSQGKQVRINTLDGAKAMLKVTTRAATRRIDPWHHQWRNLPAKTHVLFKAGKSWRKKLKGKMEESRCQQEDTAA